MSASVVSPAPQHPLLHPLRLLLSDLLSTLVFVTLYALTGNAALAIGVAIALGIVQIVRQKLRRLPIDTMQWFSLFLVVVFGGASVLTHNPAFIMIKPTVVYLAVGIVMLKPGWMNRYVPPIVHDHGADITTAFGYAWATLMLLLAAANLAVATKGSHAAWAWFIAAVPLAGKIVMVLAQYGVTRWVVRRRIQAAKAVPLAAS